MILSSKRIQYVTYVGLLHVSFLFIAFIGFLIHGYKAVGNNLYLSNIGQIHQLRHTPSDLLIGLHFAGSIVALSFTYFVYLNVPAMLKQAGAKRERLSTLHRNLGWIAVIAYVLMLIPGATETIRIFTGHFKYYLLFSGTTIVIMSLMVARTGLNGDRSGHHFWGHWLVNLAMLQALTTCAIWSGQTLFPSQSQTALYVAVYLISLSALVFMLFGLINHYLQPENRKSFFQNGIRLN